MRTDDWNEAAGLAIAIAIALSFLLGVLFPQTGDIAASLIV